MGSLFRDSRVKLSMALKYIEQVDAGLRAYDSNNPTSARFKGTGELEITSKEIPPEILSTLGDAIHNMRAALDLMAAELARINNKGDKNVYFPFSDSKEELSAQIDNKKFYRAGDDAVALLEKFQPYRGGNEKLRAIHDLDIRDKHKSIIETQRVLHDLNLAYRLDEGPSPPIAVKVTNSHEFLDGPLAGMPLIKTSKELVQLVEGVIEAFARMIESRETGRGQQ
jgi:hypothetical protein